MDVDIQAKLAPALAATHNFIREYDDKDIQELLNCDAVDQATLPGLQSAKSQIVGGISVLVQCGNSIKLN